MCILRALSGVHLLTRQSPPGIKAKVENKGQYDEYLSELKPLREELGVNLKEDLYPDPSRSNKFGAESA